MRESRRKEQEWKKVSKKNKTCTSEKKVVKKEVMNKRGLFLRDSNNYLVEVKVVCGYKEGNHSKEYVTFDLAKPVLGVGLIGVQSDSVFALHFKTNTNKRYAFVVYLDGVNVSQVGGIKSLNEIPESNRGNYNAHRGAFISPNKGEFYLDRYSQASGANRTFTFTDLKNAGINENLINDTSLKNRIEIYVWEETPESIDDFDTETVRFSKGSVSYNSDSDIRFSKTTAPEKEVKIGAGEATNKKYEKAKELHKPKFLGKLMFVYVEQSNLLHLGQCVVNVGKEFDFTDPMDLIPKS